MKDKEEIKKNESNETDAERTIRRNKEHENQQEEVREANNDEKTTLANDVDSDPVKPGYGI